MRLIDFDIYRDLLKEKSGLDLTQDKVYLLESRLNPIASEWDFVSLEAMTANIRAVPEPELIDDIVEAMTVNETSFFRDIHPFDTFKNHVVPYLLKNRIHKRSMRIWCNAVSSGQEAYSLAMILYDLKSQFAKWNIEIFGTDISEIVLNLAEDGKYSQFEVQRGLPVKLLLEHFKQQGDNWQLSKKICKMVDFMPFNLLDNMTNFEEFDVVFCRNVLDDFDKDMKVDVLKRLANQMPDDGFLFLGDKETLIGLTDDFELIPNMRNVYAKKNSVHLTN